jgi:hypothetical protein
VKTKELANEIVGFNGLIFFPLFFFNELTIKCVVRFGGFVKISKDPWQLMVEIGLVSSMHIIILLICDNVFLLII